MSDFNSQLIQQALHEYELENYAYALELLTPLAESGDPKAQCYLASLYQCGLGVAINSRKAVELYLQVAKQCIRDGRLSAVAYNNLATIYRSGTPGIIQDEEKANKYSELAKKLGFEM
jgi:TPR repeat protein